jgi:undecaprenyl diphosphate synthase
MLWQLEYSEMYFTQVLWPNFTIKELNIALKEYTDRQRRFGK